MMHKSRFGSKVSGAASRADDRSSNRSEGPDPAEEGADHYERSSEQRGERSGKSATKRAWGRKSERAGAEQSASARFTKESISSNERIERARALIARTIETSKDAQQGAKPADRAGTVTDQYQSSAAFDDADPFEPFEQCVPDSAHTKTSEQPAPGESVYSRSSQNRRKPSDDKKASKRPPRSLKGRALGYLSRREHSRAELSRKLKPFVLESDSLEDVLDALERDGWLSNARFVESVVHRRAGSFGSSRIVGELKRHQVGEELIGQTGDELSRTELARAHAVWERKYGTPPQTQAERAKQSRFLAARGFSGGTIAKVIKGGDEDIPFDAMDPIDD